MASASKQVVTLNKPSSEMKQAHRGMLQAARMACERHLRLGQSIVIADATGKPIELSGDALASHIEQLDAALAE